MTELHDALQAEYAAVFGYGVVGAHLGVRLLNAVRKAEEAHRKYRDAVLERLAATGATPPAAEPAYALPFAVIDRDNAIKLAIHIEERTAAVWRAVLGGTQDADRELALDALIDTAVRASRWRKIVGAPTTVPFPGAPG